jgi:hypothetical protein
MIGRRMSHNSAACLQTAVLNTLGSPIIIGPLQLAIAIADLRQQPFASSCYPLASRGLLLSSR